MGCGHLRPLGHAILARTVTSLIGDAAGRVRRRQQRPGAAGRNAGGDASAAAGLTARPLPPAMLAEVARLPSVAASGRCARGDELRSLSHRVVSGDWQWVRRDPRQPAGPDKPGFLSLSAPSVLELEVGPVPAGTLAIGFLRSYDERMGEMRVSCARGCECNATTMHGWHSRRSSVLAFGTLSQVSAPLGAACTLALAHRPRGAGAPAGRLGAASAARKAAAAAAEQSGNVSSKFKLITVVAPPFHITMDDRDLSSARGFSA